MHPCNHIGWGGLGVLDDILVEHENTASIIMHDGLDGIQQGYHDLIQVEGVARFWAISRRSWYFWSDVKFIDSISHSFFRVFKWFAGRWNENLIDLQVNFCYNAIH